MNNKSAICWMLVTIFCVCIYANTMQIAKQHHIHIRLSVRTQQRIA